MDSAKIPVTIEEYFDMAYLADQLLADFNNACNAGLGELAVKLHTKYVELEIALALISKELKQQLNDSEDF